MVAGVFVFADHMSPRPERFNSRFSLLGQSSFLSWQNPPTLDYFLKPYRQDLNFLILPDLNSVSANEPKIGHFFDL